MPRRLLTLPFILAALPGCYACPQLVTSAFVVTVANEATGAGVCDATVTATVGNKLITLNMIPQSLMPGACSYQDEPGTSPAGEYTIAVTAPGFQAATVYTTVQIDHCGDPDQKNLAVVMKPASK